MKLSRDTWTKIGITLAVLLVVYLLYRSMYGKSKYAEWVPSPDEVYDNEPDDYAVPEDDGTDYAEETDDYMSDSGFVNNVDYD